VDLTAPELEARVGSVRPLSLASDRGGALYVVDAERDRILVFDYSGAFQRELGGYGGRSGSFSGLTGVAVSARGRIVTAERPRAPRGKRADPNDSTIARARIQWLEAGGRLLTSVWSPPLAAGASELSVALAVDALGRVAIAAERSGEVCVLSPDGAPIARLTGLDSPRALAFADDGTLLVAETGAARVRRWTLEPERTD
jgi:sugar lactone lactonase YvrE